MWNEEEDMYSDIVEGMQVGFYCKLDVFVVDTHGKGDLRVDIRQRVRGQPTPILSLVFYRAQIVRRQSNHVGVYIVAKLLTISENSVRSGRSNFGQLRHLLGLGRAI